MTPPDDPEKASGAFSSDESYQAWLRENPQHREVLLKVLDRLMAEKLDTMPPEKAEELQALKRQLRDETADYLIPQYYQPLAQRLRKLVKLDRLTKKQFQELLRAEKELERLIHMARDLKEPRLSEVSSVLLDSQAKVRAVLKRLQPL